MAQIFPQISLFMLKVVLFKLVPVILATWEVEIRRIVVQGHPKKK
jgi:hypothetical protein